MKHPKSSRAIEKRPGGLGGKGLGRRGYPAEVREQAIALIRRRQEQGIELGACARELGISMVTLRKWLETASQGSELGRAAAFTQVSNPVSSPWRVVTLAGHAPAPARGITLITPGGYRLEGMSLEQALVALERVR